MTGIKTRSALKTLTDANLPSGTAAISAANHRALVKSMIDSLRAHGDGEVIVENMTTTTPPAPTTSLEAYVVGSGATGDWLGRDNAIAIWDDSVSPNEWFFIEPVDGQAVWNKADDAVYRWDGDVSPSAWIIPGASSFSGARVQLSSAETISNNTHTAIPWDTDSTGAAFDVGNYWASGNPTRLTAPETGYYLVSGSIDTESFSNAHTLYLWIGVNGEGSLGKAANGYFSNSTTGGSKVLSISTVLKLNVNDYIELNFLQISTASRDLDATDATHFSIVRLGT